MDGTEYLIKVLSKFQVAEFQRLLRVWGVFSERKLQSLNFNQNKRELILQIATLCEDNGITVKQTADLEIMFYCAHPQQKRWSAYQMSRMQGDEDAHLVDIWSFKKKFESNLKLLVRNVTINILERGEAFWIRIAWGKRHTSPNQLKASYAVYYPQTPFVFLSNLTSQYRVYFSQALVIAAQYTMLKEMDLCGHCLDSLRDIAFKRFNPALTAHHRKPLQQLNVAQESVQDPRITMENAKENAHAKRLTTAAFGDGPLPKLEEVQYRLQTAFKDDRNLGILSDRGKPFRCIAKFSSPNILESLRALSALGIVDVPISTMFSSIPEKRRNYFKVTDRRTPGHNASAS
uniref:Centromere protein N-B n=1 Tax=Callorhinchus milii TaxID=7868 RepID=V9L1B0_CALMI